MGYEKVYCIFVVDAGGWRDGVGEGGEDAAGGRYYGESFLSGMAGDVWVRVVGEGVEADCGGRGKRCGLWLYVFADGGRPGDDLYGRDAGGAWDCGA